MPPTPAPNSAMATFETPVPLPRTQSPQLCPVMSRTTSEESAAQRGYVSGGEVDRKWWSQGTPLWPPYPSQSAEWKKRVQPAMSSLTTRW